ncbi:MAG TPA: DNA-directed RNA polymerase subunit alpha [Candidatus Paceibacterota bacterium]|jgi:DNA-directed RNA polymerase subunit alpha|nr:DNA-directed RNA polymerase subunit alpha [Candidatus Paceibacterota bacterium]HQI26000.1 DNA-directed RNA polymerase subunit alpha [Candidatus Paceibacterota bacterium]
MPDFNIIIPSKPRVIAEDEFSGVYEIEGLYPGYGHTLGNSLRRIILSSLPGFSITSLKVDGVDHEFSTIDGVKEDVINIILNLKRIKFKVTGDDSQVVKLRVKGPKTVTAGDLDLPGQVEVINKEQEIATVTDKNTELAIEMTLDKGLGYVSKDILKKDKVEVGTIAVDATFTPIRKASYEVENMRVGNRTDFNKLRLSIETDGTLTPREAMEKSIRIMIDQLKAIIGFVEEEEEIESDAVIKEGGSLYDDLEYHSAIRRPGDNSIDENILKTRIEDLDLSVRTIKALTGASIRTVSGLARKKESDLLEISGLGDKGIQEIKRALGSLGITLK